MYCASGRAQVCCGIPVITHSKQVFNPDLLHGDIIDARCVTLLFVADRQPCEMLFSTLVTHILVPFYTIAVSSHFTVFQCDEDHSSKRGGLRAACSPDS